jgi:hypothetical protein
MEPYRSMRPAKAAVGTYLNSLGLPSTAIAAIEARSDISPYHTSWLQPDDAKNLGIDIAEIPSDLIWPKPTQATRGKWVQIGPEGDSLEDMQAMASDIASQCHDAGTLHIFKSLKSAVSYYMAAGPFYQYDEAERALKYLLDHPVVPRNSMIVSGRFFGDEDISTKVTEEDMARAMGVVPLDRPVDQKDQQAEDNSQADKPEKPAPLSLNQPFSKDKRHPPMPAVGPDHHCELTGYHFDPSSGDCRENWSH